jgi:hypothetical protein
MQCEPCNIMKGLLSRRHPYKPMLMTCLDPPGLYMKYNQVKLRSARAPIACRAPESTAAPELESRKAATRVQQGAACSTEGTPAGAVLMLALTSLTRSVPHLPMSQNTMPLFGCVRRRQAGAATRPHPSSQDIVPIPPCPCAKTRRRLCRGAQMRPGAKFPSP